jgi:hypothetical protein
LARLVFSNVPTAGGGVISGNIGIGAGSPFGEGGKYEAQVNDLNPYKEKYEGIVEQRRTKLLERLPEDRRETFKNKDLDVLEFMVSELKSKPSDVSARNLVGTKNQEFGGYGSWQEFAIKDPEGASKAIEESTTNFIK